MKIKFRAWDKNENKMYNWDDFGEDGDGFFSDYSPVTGYGDDFPSEKDGIVLMQYSSKKDQTGKDIYDGDIISFFNTATGKHEVAVPVIFIDCNFAANDGMKNYWLGSRHIKNIKIIGNIHEGHIARR